MRARPGGTENGRRAHGSTGEGTERTDERMDKAGQAQKGPAAEKEPPGREEKKHTDK